MRPTIFNRAWLAVILIAIASTPTLAGEVAGLSAVITGPAEVEAGNLVILDATESDADHLRWVCLNASPPDFLQTDNGRKLGFAAPPGVYTFAVIAVKVDQDNRAIVATQTHTVTVKGAPPGPDPIPDTLADRVAGAFVAGPDLVSDAAILHGVFSALASAVIEPGTTLRTEGDVITAADRALRAAGWVAGKYPKLSELIGDTLGRDVGETPLTPATRATLAGKFNLIAQGARKAGGK